MYFIITFDWLLFPYTLVQQLVIRILRLTFRHPSNAIQEAKKCTSYFSLIEMGEKSCEIKSGSQEMATNFLKGYKF